MALKRGDIVLVPFPFTDLTSLKVRPALIVSSNPQGDDIVIAFISSVLPESLGKTEFLLSAESAHFPVSGLKKASVFKMDKLVTVSSNLILRRLGRTTPTLQKKLDKLLKLTLSL